MARWLAVLALLVWPAAIWHDATTLHEICPDHGETLDVAGPLRVSAEEALDDGPRLSNQESDRDDHELCPFVTLAQPSSPASEMRAESTHLREAARVPAPACGARLSIPILLLAPKHSPPAIA